MVLACFALEGASFNLEETLGGSLACTCLFASVVPIDSLALVTDPCEAFEGAVVAALTVGAEVALFGGVVGALAELVTELVTGAAVRVDAEVI